MVFDVGAGEGVTERGFISTPGIHTQAQKRLEPHVSKAFIIWTGNALMTPSVRTRGAQWCQELHYSEQLITVTQTSESVISPLAFSRVSL